jgi:serine/threonine protein kinase
MVKKVGKYELGRTLGEGTFGKVKYAMNTETNEAVAIKVLDKEKIQKQNMGNQIKKEISIMKMVKHEYIVGMIEVLASKTKIFIVLELIVGGELFDKIVTVGKLSEEQAFFYFDQLVEGVEYCHKLGVCHRDLKPENLLLDEHGDLKISDFGLSSLYVGDAEMDGASRTELLHTTCGTPNYVAPEVIADQGYDGKKADVWSIGVILYVLLAGFLPFDEGTIMALFSKIQKAEFTYPKWFSLEVRALLDQVLVADPKVRISLTQLKEHPWMVHHRGHINSAVSKLSVSAPVGEGEGGRETKAAVPIPTKEQVDAAVSGMEHEVLEDDEDDQWGALIGRTARGPRYLNAFDLVSQCGGFHLERIFNPQVLRTIQSSGQSTNALPGVGSLPKEEVTIDTSELKKLRSVKSARFGQGSASKQRDSVNFTSSVASAEDLMKAVYEALRAMGFEFETSVEAAMTSGKYTDHISHSSDFVPISRGTRSSSYCYLISHT